MYDIAAALADQHSIVIRLYLPFYLSRITYMLPGGVPAVLLYRLYTLEVLTGYAQKIRVAFSD